MARSIAEATAKAEGSAISRAAVSAEAASANNAEGAATSVDVSFNVGAQHRSAVLARGAPILARGSPILAR